MKIHALASPPPGMTFTPMVVETVEVMSRGTGFVVVSVRLRTGATVAVFEVECSDELPVPGDSVNVSLWRDV